MGGVADVGRVDAQFAEFLFADAPDCAYLGAWEERQSTLQHLSALLQFACTRFAVGQTLVPVRVPRERVPEHAIASPAQGFPYDLS